MSYLLEFFEKLSESNKGQIYYYPNNGNAGDALINMGFYTLSAKYNLKYELISYDSIYKIKEGDIVLIAGGGCLVPEWDSTPKFVRAINALSFKVRLVVLPHSIRQVDEIINSFPDNTIVFCREKYSYDYCIEKSNAKEIYLENDIAFYIDLDELKKPNSSNFKINKNYKNIIRKILIKYHSIVSKKISKIFAMRTDKESNDKVNIKRTLVNDFSLVASFGAGQYQESLYSSRQFLNLINMYDEIHTDRLHVAIGATLLGKKVYVYNNGYYKCKGVYEQSMKHLSNVSFVE